MYFLSITVVSKYSHVSQHDIASRYTTETESLNITSMSPSAVDEVATNNILHTHIIESFRRFSGAMSTKSIESLIRY